MLYTVCAFVIVLIALFVASDVSFSRSRQLRWWHFWPWSSLLVCGAIGYVVTAILTPACTSSAEERILHMCYPIIGFAFGSAVGAIIDEAKQRNRT